MRQDRRHRPDADLRLQGLRHRAAELGHLSSAQRGQGSAPAQALARAAASHRSMVRVLTRNCRAAWSRLVLPSSTQRTAAARRSRRVAVGATSPPAPLSAADGVARRCRRRIADRSVSLSPPATPWGRWRRAHSRHSVSTAQPRQTVFAAAIWLSWLTPVSAVGKKVCRGGAAAGRALAPVAVQAGRCCRCGLDVGVGVGCGHGDPPRGSGGGPTRSWPGRFVSGPRRCLGARLAALLLVRVGGADGPDTRWPGPTTAAGSVPAPDTDPHAVAHDLVAAVSTHLVHLLSAREGHRAGCRWSRCGPGSR